MVLNKVLNIGSTYDLKKNIPENYLNIQKKGKSCALKPRISLTRLRKGKQVTPYSRLCYMPACALFYACICKFTHKPTCAA